jgi:hypothetical protein
MILFIPRTGSMGNGGFEEPDWEWLPRICPVCSGDIVGHGRREKLAHDEWHTSIRIRRGRCNGCGLTCTVLPAWSLPRTQYSLYTRQKSSERYENGLPLEQAAPPLRDPDRTPDASTLRRWFERRLGSLLCWLKARIPLPPTILAWDLTAALRILVRETKPDANQSCGP